MTDFSKTILGVEFGSTRIKAVLIDETHHEVASGSHDWENRLEDGIWTYSLEDIWGGFQDCYHNLKEDVRARYGVTLTEIGAIGLSAMMHGYMPFDSEGHLLVPFRTWRNTMTIEASEALTKLFNYSIPQRWSIAHLYQAILNKEAHVKDITSILTLEGYVQWMLTGKKNIGIGEASGMFPVDVETKQYDQTMIDAFSALPEVAALPWNIRDLLPEILLAGEEAGTLTEEGAKLIDPEGDLKPGIPFCPAEGDAETGMAATNSILPKTGNVSAGTSVFAMIVLEKPLKKPHPEIDIVMTPDGNLCAMVHCNNCTSDINAWVGLFKEMLESFGVEVDMNRLYGTLFEAALKGDPDCGGMLSYNYYSGEHVVGVEEGRPLFVRLPESKVTLANFMRTNLYSAVGVLKTGLDILSREEGVTVDTIYGHGGFFKTPVVGQRVIAAAMNTPISVMQTASEGGAWGIAILASYMKYKEEDETLVDYLEQKVFADAACSTVEPVPEEVESFNQYINRYHEGLDIEKAAITHLS